MRPQRSPAPSPLGHGVTGNWLCRPSSDRSKACLRVSGACHWFLQTAGCLGGPTAPPAQPVANPSSGRPGSTADSRSRHKHWWRALHPLHWESEPVQLLPCSGLPQALIRNYFCSPPLPHVPLLSCSLGPSGALRRGFLKGPALLGTGRGHQLSGKQRTGQKQVTQRSSKRERDTGRSRCRERWEWGRGSKMGPAGWAEWGLGGGEEETEEG